MVADTNDQYGVFQILLPYLQSPKSMMTQSVVKLPSAMRRELVNKYESSNGAPCKQFDGLHDKPTPDGLEDGNLRAVAALTPIMPLQVLRNT